MSAGSRQALAFRTLRYTGLKLSEFIGGMAKARPSKSSGNPTSGVYNKDNITFGCENLQAPFPAPQRVVRAGFAPPALLGLSERSENRRSSFSKSPLPLAKPDQ